MAKLDLAIDRSIDILRNQWTDKLFTRVTMSFLELHITAKIEHKTNKTSTKIQYKWRKHCNILLHTNFGNFKEHFLWGPLLVRLSFCEVSSCEVIFLCGCLKNDANLSLVDMELGLSLAIYWLSGNFDTDMEIWKNNKLDMFIFFMTMYILKSVPNVFTVLIL